ncbi:MAG: hypothetical protein ACLQVM_30330, partial [Terriglobia bacterium]
ALGHNVADVVLIFGAMESALRWRRLDDDAITLSSLVETLPASSLRPRKAAASCRTPNQCSPGNRRRH